MLLKATSPAAYSVSPRARSFHTMTMAMQRASPIIIRPTMYSGLSRRKTMARMNMSTGPTSQFWASDSASTLRLRKTSPNSSYFTLAKGGYIIRIRPMAMGMLVVPTWNWLINDSTDGSSAPMATPAPMARKIHKVRKRSSLDSRGVTPEAGIAGGVSWDRVLVADILVHRSFQPCKDFILIWDAPG